mgnify:CR=1 FL=1
MESFKKPGKIIARGRTAEVYDWSELQVLKLFYEWMPLPSIQREFEITQLAFAAKIPVPQAFQLEQIDGRNGIIYEKVNGPTMLALILKQPWTVARFSRQLAEFHSAIHRLPLGGMVSFRERWFSDIQEVSGLSAQDREKLMQWVGQFPDVNQLCHFDFHPDQVMFTSRGVRILDWMTACSGDPAADVARTKILLTIGKPPDAGWLLRTFADFLGAAAFYFYQKKYLALNPEMTQERIDAWFPALAAVRLLEDIEGEETRLRRIVKRFLSS